MLSRMQLRWSSPVLQGLVVVGSGVRMLEKVPLRQEKGPSVSFGDSRWQAVDRLELSALRVLALYRWGSRAPGSVMLCAVQAWASADGLIFSAVAQRPPLISEGRWEGWTAGSGNRHWEGAGRRDGAAARAGRGRHRAGKEGKWKYNEKSRKRQKRKRQKAE